MRLSNILHKEISKEFQHVTLLSQAPLDHEPLLLIQLGIQHCSSRLHMGIFAKSIPIVQYLMFNQSLEVTQCFLFEFSKAFVLMLIFMFLIFLHCLLESFTTPKVMSFVVCQLIQPSLNPQIGPKIFFSCNDHHHLLGQEHYVCRHRETFVYLKLSKAGSQSNEKKD